MFGFLKKEKNKKDSGPMPDPAAFFGSWPSGGFSVANPAAVKPPLREFSMGTDPYIRKTSSIEPRIGLTVTDEANLSGARRSISLSFERTDDCPQKSVILRRDPAELLCGNAATALDADGTVRHVWADDPRLKTFAGFMSQNLHPDKVLLLTAGAVFLRVEGLQSEDKGRKVFATAPDRFFTLKNEPGSILVGHVRFAQPDWPGIASVAFDSGLGK